MLPVASGGSAAAAALLAARRLVHTAAPCCAKEAKVIAPPEEVGYAFNHVEKKKYLYKPKHTIDEQIQYMASRAYWDAYKGLPVYKWYRRNIKGQWVLQPPPRMYCIDTHGRFKLNNACPICRDEYLFFDYRNPALIEQFLVEGTDQPVELLQSGLCRDQYRQLQAQLLKAREHGMIDFAVEFRHFDYSQWYPWIPKEDDASLPTRAGTKFTDFWKDPLVPWPTFMRDRNNSWDEWWKRFDTIAKKGK